MRKRVLALTLALLLCLSLTVTAAASSETMYIGSVNDLLEFKEALKTNTSLNAVLTADIDLTGVDWVALANYSTYDGDFDGKGHTISGLSGRSGFIYAIGPEGSVQNLNLADISIDGFDLGGLAHENWGEILNCTVSGSIISSGNNTGGIAGDTVSGMIKGCQSYVDITFSSYFNSPGGVGGITGGVASRSDCKAALIDQCEFHGSISVSGESPHCSRFVGGIAGLNDLYALIANCVNTGSISVNIWTVEDDDPVFVGGITGGTDKSWIENCANTGTIYVKSKDCQLGCNGLDGGCSWLNSTQIWSNNSWSSGAVIAETLSGDEGQEGNPTSYFLEGTNINAGDSPTFSLAELTDGTLVNKLNEYVAKNGDLAFERDAWDHLSLTKRDCRLLAWTQGPNGPELTDSYEPPQPTIPDNNVPTPTFADVPAGAWYAAPVAWAVEKEITNGTGNNKFSPEKTCNNAEILTFLWRACDKPDAPAASFSDVASGVWYADAASWAKSKGMISGDKLSPDTPCTRASAVMFIWQAMGKPAASETASFSDVPADADYAAAVAWAVEKGVTNGTGADTFSPDTICNRGHIVTFLQRAFAE